MPSPRVRAGPRRSLVRAPAASPWSGPAVLPAAGRSRGCALPPPALYAALAVLSAAPPHCVPARPAAASPAPGSPSVAAVAVCGGAASSLPGPAAPAAGPLQPRVHHLPHRPQLSCVLAALAARAARPVCRAAVAVAANHPAVRPEQVVAGAVAPFAHLPAGAVRPQVHQPQPVALGVGHQPDAHHPLSRRQQRLRAVPAGGRGRRRRLPLSRDTELVAGIATPSWSQAAGPPVPLVLFRSCRRLLVLSWTALLDSRFFHGGPHAACPAGPASQAALVSAGNSRRTPATSSRTSRFRCAPCNAGSPALHSAA